MKAGTRYKFPRVKCLKCGKIVAENWMVRHECITNNLSTKTKGSCGTCLHTGLAPVYEPCAGCWQNNEFPNWENIT